MRLFSPLQLINILLATSYSTFAIFITFNSLFPQFLNGSGQQLECIISSIDKIQIPILPLLSSNVYDDHGDKTDFLMQCRYEYSNDRLTLSKIDEFELNYSSEQAVYWYTRDTFVYRIVNKILRSGNVQMINKCLFFIRDLHRQISYLHKNKYQRDIVQPSQIYYRGMILSMKDIGKLVVGKLITFNSFISASSSREVAMMFAGNALLQIDVNNRTGLYAIFHSISDLSYFKHEEEILFSIGNTFQVEQIRWCKKKSIWEIKLILQKHIQYRSNFEGQSTNNMKRKLIKRICQGLIKSSVEIFKVLSSYRFFSAKPFWKSTIR